MRDLILGTKRRWNRQRRRRTVGRAYDMALEIARTIPHGASVLDVGCGSGYIAHHLKSLLDSRVLGIDVGTACDAQIPYLSFDGRHFPVADQSFDAVLVCYVLHHAQNCDLVMAEIKRVLTPGGLVIVYEDMPVGFWNQAICWTHDKKWRGRTGPCTFFTAHDWRRVFSSAGFEVDSERALSRWRRLVHPVSRRIFVLKLSEISEAADLRERACAAPVMDEGQLVLSPAGAQLIGDDRDS